MNTFSKRTIGLGLLLIFSACKKEKQEVYVIPDQTLSTSAADKKSMKTDQEYISILYSDLFSANISNNKLNELGNLSESFADKQVINNLFLANFLNSGSVQMPTKAQMLADPGKFVEDTYLKFYTRKPNELEKYYFTNMIISDSSITPKLIYYSFGTSVEYRFY